MQQRLLVLLKTFHQYAVSHHFKYSLDWGALLGAVRHQGFIPWDDDLDVMVDRETYHLILQTIGQDLTIERFSRKSLWIDRIRLKDSDVDWKLLPTIDLFVIDNVPDGWLSRKIQYFGMVLLMGMIKGWPEKGNLLQRSALISAHLLGKCFPRETRAKWFHQFSQRWNHVVTAKKVCYNDEIAALTLYYDADVLDEVMLVPFEDTEVYITKIYHHCLTAQYGDYMKPVYREPIHICYEEEGRRLL